MEQVQDTGPAPPPPHDGLTEAEAKARLAVDGPNELQRERTISPWRLVRTRDLQEARKLAFSKLVFGELFRAFAARSADRVFWEVGAFTSLRLVGIVAVSALVQLGLHHIPVTQALFQLGALSLADCALSVLMGLVPVTIVGAAEAPASRVQRPHSPPHRASGSYAMKSCACREVHVRKAIVLTGGPGAGKTAVLELIRQSFCEHVIVLPESASLLFGGGFPRRAELPVRRAAQRAIFYVQRELARCAGEGGEPAIVLCDRGTVDGAAYWPGPSDLWSEVGTGHELDLRRYAAVIHLRVPSEATGYEWSNPVRTESALEVAAIDERIAHLWAGHPRRCFVESTAEFLQKALRAVEVLRRELPQCCRKHLLLGEGP